MLGKKTDKLSLKILDPLGNVVKELDVGKEKEPGVHRVTWDAVSGPAPKEAKTKSAATVVTPPGQPVRPGNYLIVLDADGVSHRRLLTVEADPRPSTAAKTMNGEKE